MSAPAPPESGGLQNPYIISALVLAVREAIGLLMAALRAVISRSSINKAAESAHEDAAFARLDKLTCTLQGEIDKLKTALDAERAARESADEKVRALRHELAEMRLSLAHAGCVAQECIKSGRCVLDQAGPTIAAPCPVNKGL
jgi:multidrug resistance efflux pump